MLLSSSPHCSLEDPDLWLHCMPSAPILAAYLAAFVIAAVCLVRHYIRLDLDKMPTPTWREWFQLVLDQPRCHAFFRQWHEKYGPVFRLWLVYREFVLVADPAIAAQILGKGPQYVHQKVPEYAALNPVSNNRIDQFTAKDGTRPALTICIPGKPMQTGLAPKRCHETVPGDKTWSNWPPPSIPPPSTPPLVLPQAHGMHNLAGMLGHLDERVWKAHRSAIAPAYTASAVK